MNAPSESLSWGNEVSRGALKTFVSRPAGILSLNSCSMMPQAMLQKPLPVEAMSGFTLRLARPK
jgi:hypothetical protein